MAMREKKGGSSLFLMELIIVLFFFLLTAAVCIQVFAKAHLISRSSLELSHAQSQCTSAAEIFSGTDGSKEAFLEKFPEGTATETGVELFYDGKFQSCEKKEAEYRMVVELKEESGGSETSAVDESASHSRTAVIRFLRGTDNAEIYSLTVHCHIPLTAGKEADS